MRPQPGPQTAFLASPADIAIYGGAAGGGKSYALLLEPMRHLGVNGFSAVVFRRTLADVKKPGSLLDTSMILYGPAGANIRQDTLTWYFNIGKAKCKIAFGHLEHDNTVLDWQGAQIPLLLFDELTHFTRSQFFYMLSRNRSTCGIRPYVRATTNPDSDSWVAEFIEWWLDPVTGLPIPERSGVIRWFVRVNDSLVWGDSREELVSRFPDQEPKSLTFIAAKLTDNAILMAADPGYRSNLMALPMVERERLLGGNWKIRPAAGLYFQRSWCEVVDAVPAGCQTVRYWDLAATEKIEGNDPDWTVGVKMSRSKEGIFYIENVIRLRASPMGVETAIKNTASADGRSISIGLPKDPAQAGKAQASYFIRELAGYTVRATAESGKKITRFGPFSSQAQAGNVKILRSAAKEDFLSSLEGFPEVSHDDDADAVSGAFSMLFRPTVVAASGSFSMRR